MLGQRPANLLRAARCGLAKPFPAPGGTPPTTLGNVPARQAIPLGLICIEEISMGQAFFVSPGVGTRGGGSRQSWVERGHR